MNEVVDLAQRSYVGARIEGVSDAEIYANQQHWRRLGYEVGLPNGERLTGSALERFRAIPLRLFARQSYVITVAVNWHRMPLVLAPGVALKRHLLSVGIAAGRIWTPEELRDLLPSETVCPTIGHAVEAVSGVLVLPVRPIRGRAEAR